MNPKREVAALQEELVRLRRDFHMYPELGFEEIRTGDKVAAYLEENGLEVSRLAKTGVIGLLKGEKPGKTLLLRADMDALPIQEQNELSYKSVHEEKMHACGHDGHVAMLLVAAKILSAYKERLAGNIKFVFQPNEEDAGAYLMIEEGVMENPSVDAVAGAHLWSNLCTGTVDICAGSVMAASHYFFLTIKGKGGHAGYVDQAVDPIMISANVIQAVQSMQTRELDALSPVSIVFTRVNAGFNTTIVPEVLEMQGSIRFLFGDGSNIKENFERIISNLCSAYRAEYDLSYKVGNEILINDPEMTVMARQAAVEILGDENNVKAGLRSMGGEDFSDFSRLVPGVFYFIGSGNQEKKTNYSLHHPCFNLDEDALPIGTEMHIRVALKFFGLDGY